MVGRSTHSLEQAREACEEAVDYIAFGPIYATETKASPGDPRGIERLTEVVLAVRQPVIAIGGIGLGNVARVAETGVAGIAVISAIAEASDPRHAARALAEALRERGGA